MNLPRRRLLAGLAELAGVAALAGCAPKDALDHIAGGFEGVNLERGHALRDGRDASLPISRTRRTRVVIAGGGVAGLAAARALRQRGQDDFVLFELEDEAGGNSRSTRVGGLDCPIGAHYLPQPGDDASEVQALLEELGLCRRVAGRWEYDERQLCHSPQERLFLHGHWQDGLLPRDGVGEATRAQYRRFAALVAQASATAAFAIPAQKRPFSASQRALDAMVFNIWLDQQGLDDAYLRWYLNYCCQDDYGAGSARVSAWAGIHYFASRHGFAAPGEAEHDAPVLTWPEGNAFLTRALAAPLGERLRGACSVLRIAEQRHGVEVDVYDAATHSVERWQAERCIVALPVFVAARVVREPPDALRRAAAAMSHAPWLVANLHLRAPLRDRPGAAPSWDTVLFDARDGGLGYVDARHQSLDPRPGPTVLTHYRALGDMAQGRQLLLQRSWRDWCALLLAELGQAHPDLSEQVDRIAITRHGHAMATPTPGLQSLLRDLAVERAPASARLRFAHSDWSGYSIFEEAFTRGHLAGLVV